MPVFGIATFSDVHELYLYLCLWTRRLAKATGAEPSGWMERSNIAGGCGAKHSKPLQLRSTFGSSMWKKWTLLPCEAHSEVKIIKTRQNTSLSEHLWRKADFEAKMLKKCGFRALWTVEMFTQSARGCGAKHISKSKWWKFCGFEALWTVGTFRKCIAVVARSTFRSQNAENTSGSALLEVEPSIFCGRRNGFCTLRKSEHNVRVL